MSDDPTDCVSVILSTLVLFLVDRNSLLTLDGSPHFNYNFENMRL